MDFDATPVPVIITEEERVVVSMFGNAETVIVPPFGPTSELIVNQFGIESLIVQSTFDVTSIFEVLARATISSIGTDTVNMGGTGAWVIMYVRIIPAPVTKMVSVRCVVDGFASIVSIIVALFIPDSLLAVNQVSELVTAHSIFELMLNDVVLLAASTLAEFADIVKTAAVVVAWVTLIVFVIPDPITVTVALLT